MAGDYITTDPDSRQELYRERLTEWLLTFGMRWVSWQEIGEMVALGYPEREGYLERKQGSALNEYLHFRLTQKGLEFINEK